MNLHNIVMGALVILGIVLIAFATYIIPVENARNAEKHNKARLECVKNGGKIKDEYSNTGGFLYHWYCEGAKP